MAIMAGRGDTRTEAAQAAALAETLDERCAADLQGLDDARPGGVREMAAAEPAPVAEDVVRVPTARDLRPIKRRNRALAKMRARNAADPGGRRAQHRRAAPLARHRPGDG